MVRTHDRFSQLTNMFVRHSMQQDGDYILPNSPPPLRHDPDFILTTGTLRKAEWNLN